MISKRINIDWKDYLNDLLDSGRKYTHHIDSAEPNECMNQLERDEFAGHLFARDLKRLDEKLPSHILNIFSKEGHYFLQLLANYCITNSQDNADKVLDFARKIIAEFYQPVMDCYLDA